MHITIKALILCALWCSIPAATFAEPQKPVPNKAKTAPVLEESKSPRERVIPLITIFGSAEGPKFEDKVTPEYPFAAKQQGLEGTVVLRLSIDKFGILQKVEVMEATDQVFVPAAVASVKKSFFIPAKNNGRAIASTAVLPIHFKLSK